MSETTTEQVVDTSVADNSSTTEPTTTSADSQASTENNTQVTEPVVEAPSSASTEQTKTTETDENAALAKFAKGQGINDLSELSERELSLLKMARDNKSAFDKKNQAQPKLDESSTELATLGDDATDVQKLAAKVANMEFSSNKAKFLEGKDVTLEPVMAQIVADARRELGDDYARGLLGNLPFLYSLAEGRKPTVDTSAAVEQAKKEERTSMNQSLTASAGGANATTSKPATPIKVTSEWIRNEYNPNDPEHRALVDAAMKR